jgi:hypothetical protein
MRLPSSGFRLSCVLALLGLAGALHAQPAPTPEEVQQAQTRWNEGKAFFDKGQFEAARVTFKQAYTAFPHPAFLQNLGEAELRTGRNVEAARHLAQFLRSSSSGSTQQRELAKRSLQKAADPLGSILIQSNVEEAEVRVDDEVVGRTPLGSSAWYVEPGRHVVVARKEGYLDASETIDVAKGAPKDLIIRLRPIEPVGRASGSTAGGSRAEAGAKASAASSISTADEGKERTQGLDTRSVALATGIGLTLAGTAVAIVYGWKSARDADDLNALHKNLPGGGVDNCVKPAGDRALVAACDTLADASHRFVVDRNVRNVAIVTASVLGAASVVTFFLWPSDSAKPVALVPGLGPGFAGLQASGRF